MTDVQAGQKRLLRPGEKARFLKALREGYSVTRASLLAGRKHPRTFYRERERDDQFAEAWADAYETGTQVMEDELARRAAQGWLEETRDGEGNLIRVQQRLHPSDLHLMLKARRPETYGNAPVVQNTTNVGVRVEIEDRSAPLDEVVRILRAAGSSAVNGERAALPVVAGVGHVRAELGSEQGVGPADGVPVPAGD